MINFNSLNILEALAVNKFVRAKIQADARTDLQKIMFFLDHYQENKNYPDDDFIEEVKISIANLFQYINGLD